MNLSRTLLVLGKFEDAEAMARRVVDDFSERMGSDHPAVALARFNLALTLKGQDDYVGAEREHRLALELREASLEPDHPDVAASQFGLADALLGVGRMEEAVALAEKLWSHQQGDDVPLRARAKAGSLLAHALWESKPSPEDDARARRLAETAIADYRAAGEQFHTEAIAWVQEQLDAHR